MTARARARVIGIGNEFRGDDAVGLLVARRVQALADPPVEVLERDGEATALMEAWHGSGRVVLIDALQSGAPPGTIQRFDAKKQPLPAGLFSCSTHAFGLAQAVELARVMNRLPERLIIYGIEGIHFGEGSGLSPEVARSVDPVAGQVLRELEDPEMPDA